ncbi:lipid IV(A) 3-deoxy-D-manno-octulosonic acid transferase [Dechloromonas sp. ZY10]|uniref:lipid IV(A) 3-deoxy-D-manno-octulosonic acid transferase n=1 Tax=Dechloromonas aquae TaxID=2664436 RepID=UPI003527E7EE
MARWFYSLCFFLALPLIWLRLLWRARRQPDYLQHLGERHGFFPPRPDGPLIWVHAVSVGETRAAQPLIDGLLAQHPDCRILLTGMTPTGRATGREIYGERVFQCYLPYDLPFTVDRFFRHFSPRFGVLMETEVWPNLLATASRHAVPVLLANARLSARSARGYRRFAALARPAFAALSGVAAQTLADAERLQTLGAASVEVCGNLKFDVSPAADKLALGHRWRAAFGERSVWLAASTREGEEALLLAAWRQAAANGTLLILVPRHPQRFDEVASLCRAAGFTVARRSHGLPPPEAEIWLGDSMGEMAAYYAAADLAFIGGSLLPLGGQNLIEAAACGCPVLIGPHTFNFAQATDDALAAGAARRVANADDLVGRVQDLLQTKAERAAMREAAQAFAAAHRGATARMLEFIGRRSERRGADPAGS